MANEIRVGKITSPNPSLWVDTSTLGCDPTVYEISTLNPPKGGPWIFINQFCSVLSIYWLKHNPGNSFGLGDVDDVTKISMAETLISYESMEQQADYAEQSLNGKIVSKPDVITGVESGSFNTGTLIWAGSDNHVVAIRLDSDKKFSLYDSNTGDVSSYERTNFSQIINGLQCDTFVVANGD